MVASEHHSNACQLLLGRGKPGRLVGSLVPLRQEQHLHQNSLDPPHGSHPDPQELAKQVELLNAYHLDLWTEIEAQLRTLRASQTAIEELRSRRSPEDLPALVQSAALLLAEHVRTMKSRSRTLVGTIDELETAVARLLQMLRDPGAS
jgi:hypothetical protein